MNKIFTWIIIISFCMVIFNVSFDLKTYLSNLNIVFDSMPKFPNWSIDWGSLSAFDWEPLGQFFKCIYLSIKYVLDMIVWVFNLVSALFGHTISYDNILNIPFGGSSSGGGGGH